MKTRTLLVALLALTFGTFGCTQSTTSPTSDTGGIDTALSPDAGGDKAVAGSPCDSNEACESDLCVTGPDGDECAQLCDDECPAGWLCKPVGDTGERACYFESVELCKPCSTSDQCGGVLDECRQVGTAPGLFCTQSCNDESLCPGSFFCSGGQCVPETGSCVCTPDLNQTTQACERSNQFGTCLGDQLCDGGAGWTECSALEPAKDICDSVDNDCDGVADEDYPLIGQACDSSADADVCETGVFSCTDEGGMACTGDEAVAEVCNGQDDTCEGNIDEGFLNTDADGEADCVDDDDDGDGVLDGDDNCSLVANADQADTDQNGEGDACDGDFDGDGVANPFDNCPAVPNDDQADNDGDGAGDPCDPDDDDDGTDDGLDNCAVDSNADQLDTDQDGVGDVCDDDDDDDEVLDVDDNCVLDANLDQLDTDEDGEGDACDADDDDDGVLDEDDNCQLVENAGQADNDSDGDGDDCDADDDDDGVEDEADLCPWIADDQTDTDGDGQGNACDDDDDGDGLADGLDNCALTPNPGQADTDGDGKGDACESDLDADGIQNDLDNCMYVPNPNQTDTDGDDEGDACDLDDDNDGVMDTVDNCDTTPNADQIDTDSDDEGNACDPDDDNDGVFDEIDNCVLVSNESQKDLDSDGEGDACDDDWEGDGVLNGVDNCPYISNLDQTNTDQDELGDACDPDDDNDGDYDVEDCEPLDGAISHSAPEVCGDAVDNNCNDAIDEEGGEGCVEYYMDADSDGYGANGMDPKCLCAANDVEFYDVLMAGDCLDDEPAAYEGNSEICDDIDNDCNGPVDDELVQVCVADNYSGDEPFWNEGPCSKGASTCAAGAWGGCLGMVTPEPENCEDLIDNDCNAVVDDADACVVAECEGDECEFSVGDDEDGDGGDDGPFNPPEPEDDPEACEYNCGNNVAEDEDGNLVLDLTVSVIDVPYIWVANSNDKTISKINSKTGLEEGRYDVGPECGSPSRTAVNETGGVWVNCREHFGGGGGQSAGSRTVHIAGDPGTCIDRNGDGVIQTSSATYDANGNKTLNTLNWKDDECVLYSGTPQPSANAPQYVKDNPMPTDCNIGLRGLAIRADGLVLVGGIWGCREGHLYGIKFEYDPNQPYQVGVNPAVNTVDHWYLPDLDHRYRDGQFCSFDYSGHAYGYAVDQQGHVWVSSLASHIAWVDLEQRRSCSFPSNTTYGIAIDYAGRVWLGEWSGANAIGWVFEPKTKQMHTVDKWENGQMFWEGTDLPSTQYTRGASASADPNKPYGYFNMSNGNYGAVKVKVVSEDPFEARVAGILKIDDGGICGNNMSGCGISLDGQGDLWVIGMDVCGSSPVDGKNHAYAVSVELDPEKISGWLHPSGDSAKDYVNTITDQGSYTYTYSDFMGYQFATIVDPTGFYVQRFIGWGQVDDASTTLWTQAGANIKEAENLPPLTLSYRSGDTAEELAGKDFSEPVQISCDNGSCTMEMPPDTLAVMVDVKLTLKKNEVGGSVTITGISMKGTKVLAP